MRTRLVCYILFSIHASLLNVSANGQQLQTTSSQDPAHQPSTPRPHTDRPAAGTSKLRHAPYHAGRSHVEVLSWAVGLASPLHALPREQMDAIAELLAASLGVACRGQIGTLRGHYLFSHKLNNLSHDGGKDQEYFSSVQSSSYPSQKDASGNDASGNDAFLRYVIRNESGEAMSREEFTRIRDTVHELMEQHVHVAWFTPQSVRSRQKRGVVPLPPAAPPLHRRDSADSTNAFTAPYPHDKLNSNYKTSHDNNGAKTQKTRSTSRDNSLFSQFKRKNRRKASHRGGGARRGGFPRNSLVTSHLKTHVNISRTARDMSFPDPAFPSQWHLHNTVDPSMDINVTGVWQRNIRGQGVTVCVIDDGIQWTSRDLRDNYTPLGSWDLNGDDADPMPDPHRTKNHHGTRCAGEIAAVSNDYCAVGVAHQAKIAGIRMLDGPMTDSMEAAAFTTGININDIYSCSWGPDDDGKTVDGPHYLAMEAMRQGVNFGRHGYGSIYVVASGNGGRFADNCNFDGYANSIYTITIGAVDETGNMPFYAEECASMLSVTFSSGDGFHRSIVTTDWTMDGATGCTSGHTGTSAAAPLAAGMVALALQVRPCLTWRDVQYLIILTALKVDRDEGHWHKNAAGLMHSHRHGFGLMNAWRMANAAKSWQPVPWMTVFSSGDILTDENIPRSPSTLQVRFPVDSSTLQGYWLETLEHVQVTVTLSHPRRGDLEIRLLCPSGTESSLATRRTLDLSSEGFQGWSFSTVRCWGEPPHGNWTLIVTDKGRYGTGKLTKWHLRLMGSPMSVEDFQQKRRDVQQAINAVHLDSNISVPCAEPQLQTPLLIPVSEKTLKIICLVSMFCMILAFYETLEYAMCYDDEKDEYKRMLLLQLRANRIAARSAQEVTSNGDAVTENTRLLAPSGEDIPMQTFNRSTSADRSSGATASAEETAPLIPRGEIPDDILDTLSPEEIRLNMSLGMASRSMRK